MILIGTICDKKHQQLLAGKNYELMYLVKFNVFFLNLSITNYYLHDIKKLFSKI